MIDILADCGSGIGLKINAEKSDSMQLVQGLASTAWQYTVDITPIRRLSGAAHTLFGKSVGHNAVPDRNFVGGLLREMELVHGAKLAPWQKIDALQQFLFPRLPFPMSLDLINKKSARTVDQHVRAFARETLKLPQNSSVHYLYTARGQRGHWIARCEPEDRRRQRGRGFQATDDARPAGVAGGGAWSSSGAASRRPARPT